ncbi:FtsX-like permease family protein [Nocardioides dubius]|uniref:FtsX-like permease family protein n=1 Tax=Nocardioides dubius TaxID=317019 RepID=A0ABN1U0Y8_9ACTN
MLRASIKSLLGRKLRLLMSTFAIVLGVGFVTGSLVFGDTLNRSFTAIFASTVGDVVVRPEGGVAADGSPSAITLPAAMRARLEKVDGAARVDGNVTALGVYVISKDGDPIGGNGPPAIAGNFSDAPAGHGLKAIELLDGRAPETLEEIALDEATAEKAGYRIGDTVELASTGEVASLRAELVGILGFSEGGSLNGATFTAFDTRSAQKLFLGGENVYNDYWVTAEPGVTQEELRDRVAVVLPGGVEAVTGDDAADEAATGLLDQIGFLTTFLLIFAVISLIVGSFLIVNTFSILVAQRSRELALLRALGASRRQVKAMVLFEAFVLGVVGASLGLGLGVLLFYGIRLGFERFGLDLGSTPMVFEPLTVVLAYAIGIVVTMVAAAIPAWRTGRIAPIAALRDDVALPEASIQRRLVGAVIAIVLGAVAIALALFGDVPKSGYVLGVGAFAVLLGVATASPVISRPLLHAADTVFSRLFGAVGRLAGQNSLRNPRRTAATASALMIGLTLCTLMAMLGSSAKASVDRAVAENFVGDYVISNVFGAAFSPSIADEAAAIDGVDALTRVRVQFVERPDGGLGILQGIEPESIGVGVKVEMVSGRLDAVDDTDAVLLSESEASDEDLAVGDTLRLDVPVGEAKLRVAGIYRDNELFGDAWVVGLPALQELGFRPVDNYVMIRLDPAADRAQVRAALDALTEQQKLISIKDQEGLAEEARGPIDQILALIYGLLALALLIAVLGIVNTLALSVIERTREIGLLRAIGLSRRQLRLMIRLESIVISFLGAVLGVVLGLVFGYVLLKDLASQGLEVIAVPWPAVASFLALSLVIGVLAAVFPARRAAKLDVLDAIATD